MMGRMVDRRVNRGFSLIELIVVLVILGLLAAIVSLKVIKNVDKAKVASANTQIRVFDTALEGFRIDVGRYPTDQEGLRVLYENVGNIPSWDGPYLKSEIPLDPWDHEYAYRIPGRRSEFDLLSLGADGKEGGDGINADIPAPVRRAQR
ncbi:MAG TPA: type II secretion system major pseudopilin GspG [Acidobacteriota bacterium]